jgi:hypothetical protein
MSTDFRARVLARERVYGAFVNGGSSIAGEIMALAGFDWLVIATCATASRSPDALDSRRIRLGPPGLGLRTAGRRDGIANLMVISVLERRKRDRTPPRARRPLKKWFWRSGLDGVGVGLRVLSRSGRSCQRVCVASVRPIGLRLTRAAVQAACNSALRRPL